MTYRISCLFCQRDDLTTQRQFDLHQERFHGGPPVPPKTITPGPLVYWIRDKHHTDPYTEGYIGVSRISLECRTESHIRKDNEMGRALRSTGTVEVLHVGISEDEMVALEEQYRPHKYIGWNTWKGGHWYHKS